jgi:hypothetical protein
MYFRDLKCAGEFERRFAHEVQENYAIIQDI